MSEPSITEQPTTGLSEELVYARQELAAIERRIDQGRYGLQQDVIQSDYLGVIAHALVSIAASLETSTVADRLGEIGDVLETRQMRVSVAGGR